MVQKARLNSGAIQKAGDEMTAIERKVIIDVLVKNYLYEKEQNKVWGREDSTGYSIALGKLSGACTILNLNIEETDKEITILTQSRKKIITKIEKQ